MALLHWDLGRVRKSAHIGTFAKATHVDFGFAEGVRGYNIGQLHRLTERAEELAAASPRNFKGPFLGAVVETGAHKPVA